MLKYLAAAIAAFLFASPAMAMPFVSGVYLKADAGVTMDANAGGLALDNNAAFGVAAGGHVGPFRVELGANRLNANLANVIQGQANDYAATVYYDHALSGGNAVYAGAGLDRVDVTARFLNARMRDSRWGWHAAAGLSHRFNDHMVGEAQVTRLAVNDVNFGCGPFDITGYTATLGLRVDL